MTDSAGIKLVLVPAGAFKMGSNNGYDDEKPVHDVEITKAFYISMYEVTQAQYEKVMGSNPSEVKGANLPVESVSWEEAKEFCRKLSETEGARYRLPTEAEWEYACRAGSTTDYFWGNSFDGGCAWFRDNSDNAVHEVGQTKPNSWSIYDMSGNIFEWCEDWYTDSYGRGKETDPKGPNTGKYRTLRGGSWSYDNVSCRSASRGSFNPDSKNKSIGFRVVREQ